MSLTENYSPIENSKEKIISKLPKYIDNEELKKAGLGKYFYIAGGYVHDVMNDISPKDIDIFIIKEEGFLNLFTYFKEVNYKIKEDRDTHIDVIEYIVFKSIIEVRGLDMPIQLINYCKIDKNFYTYSDIEYITNYFDYDYLKTYYDGIKVFANDKCKNTWITKIIYNIYNHEIIRHKIIRKDRFLKTIKKGYIFDEIILKKLNISFENKTFDEIKEIVDNNKIFIEPKNIEDYKLASTTVEYVIILLFNTYIKNNSMITSEY